MRIIHLATVASSMRYLLLSQLVALRDDGHDVVAVSADGPDLEYLRELGIRCRPLEGSTRGFDLLADLKAMRSFVSIVREERPDLVHTHNPKPGVYGRILSRLLGVPAVVNTVHGLYATAEDSVARRGVVYGLETLASRFSDLELVQNPEDVDLMVRSPIAPSRRVRYLGNGIDLSRFDPDRVSPGDRCRIRAELGLGPHDLVIGTVARLVREKGLPELLEASRRLSVGHRLVVVGPADPDKPDALPQSMIREAERAGVLFLGHREDVESLLSTFDLFAFPSHREGFPRAAMEAAAAGLPIVAADIRGSRQVVDDGLNGRLVPRRSVDELASALGELASDPRLRARMGEASRRKAEADFDERLVVARIRDAYREVGAGLEARRSRRTMV